MLSEELLWCLVNPLDELNKILQEVTVLLLENGKITKFSQIQPENNVGENVGKDNMHHTNI